MSITLNRDALSCSRPELSTIIHVSDGRPTMTFLDADGHEIGSWWPIQGTVLWHSADGDQPFLATANTADEAAHILRPLKPAKAPEAPKAKKAKKAPKTTPVTPVTEARTTIKESTMTTTKPSLSARVDALETTASRILALLEAQAVAKAPVTTPKATKPVAEAKVTRCTAKTLAGKRCQREGVGGLCGAHKSATPVTKAPKAKKAAKAPATVATKGAKAVAGGSGLSRSAWNKTLTTKARLAGKGKGGKSVYSLVTAGWAQVQELRAQGSTPDEVLARFTK